MTSLNTPSAILAGRTVGGPASARLIIDGQEYVNFFGAGYLALSGIPEIRDAVRNALEQGVPFAQNMAAAAIGAIDPVFSAVEKAGAIASSAEASVYFSSGYLVGCVGLASLDKPFDLILLDEHAHYNLVDAARLTGVPTWTFAHRDAGALNDIIREYIRPGQKPLVATDGAFATTGALAPLADYASVLEPYQGQLFLDESHAFGVVGENGRGAGEHCGVERLTATGTTLSKAYCAQGAFVGCSRASLERVRHVSPVRGANAGSPLSAVAAAASLSYVADRPQFRRDIKTMAGYLRTRLRSIGLETIDTPAPIVSFRYGKRPDMLALQERLFGLRIYIHYSTYIGAGSEGMIRCAVFRDHAREDIDALVDALKN